MRPNLTQPNSRVNPIYVHLCLTGNEPFDFGAGPDHYPVPWIFNGIFATAGSAALAEVCSVRVLVVIMYDFHSFLIIAGICLGAFNICPMLT